MRNLRPVATVLGVLTFCCSLSMNAGEEIIEIGNIQYATTLSGTVTYGTGETLPGVKVEARSQDWKTVLRSTRTDEAGQFTLTPVPGRKVYFLQLSLKNWNLLRVRVSLSKRKGKELRLQMEVAT